MLEAVKCVKLMRITRNTRVKRDSIKDIQGKTHTSLFDLTLADGIDFSTFDKEFKKWVERNDLKESVTVKEKRIVDQDYRERTVTVNDLSCPGAKVRYRVETNFSFDKFNGIKREESTIKEEWEVLLSKTVKDMKLYTSFPSSLKIAAYVPFATPEQQLGQIMSKLRDIRAINLAEDELALDWGTSSWGGSNIRILMIRTIEEKVDQIQRILTPIPLPCGLNTYIPRKYSPQEENDISARTDMINHKEKIENGGMVEFSPMSVFFDSETLVQELIQKMVTRDRSNTFHGVITLHTGGLQLLYDTRNEVEVYEATKIIEKAIRNTTGGERARGIFRTSAVNIEQIEEAAKALRTATQQEGKDTSGHLASSEQGNTTATTITSESNDAATTGGTKRDRDETFDLNQHAKELQDLVTMARDLLTRMGNAEVLVHSQTTTSSVTDSSRGQRRNGSQQEGQRTDITSTESILSSEVQANIVRDVVAAIELAQKQTQRVNESVRERIAREQSAASLEREEHAEKMLKKILRPMVIGILEQQLEPIQKQLDSLTIDPGKIWGPEIALAVRNELAPFMQGITTAMNSLKVSVEILSRPSMSGSEMDLDPQVHESFAFTSAYDILKKIELAAPSLENNNRVLATTVMGVGRKVMRSIDHEREEREELHREALQETLKRNLMVNILHNLMESPSDMEEWKKQVTKILGNILQLEESVLKTIVEEAGYDIDLMQNEDSASTPNIGTIEVPEETSTGDEKPPAQDIPQDQQGAGRNETAQKPDSKVSILGIGGVRPKSQKPPTALTPDTPQLLQQDLNESSVTFAHVAMVETASVEGNMEQEKGSGGTESKVDKNEDTPKESMEEETAVSSQQRETNDQDMDTSQNEDETAENLLRDDSIKTEEENEGMSSQGRTRFRLSSSSEEEDKQE
eukprot:scaffold8104_cov47-Cyclotella_meneghiniana.AAC.3